jgi:hypothetical protein
MATTSGGIVESVQMLVTQFTEIAMTDPVVAAMLTSGAIITGLSVTVFGYLAAGAALDLVVDAIPAGRSPPGEGN